MLLACHRCYQLPTFNDNCLECQDCNWHQWAEDENDAVSDALEAKQLIPIFIGQEFVGKGDFDIVYSGDYESIPILKFFQILLAKLFLFWKKEQRLNKC